MKVNWQPTVPNVVGIETVCLVLKETLELRPWSEEKQWCAKDAVVVGFCLWAWKTLTWVLRPTPNFSLLSFPSPSMIFFWQSYCHKYHCRQTRLDEGKSNETLICPVTFAVISVMRNSSNGEEERKLKLPIEVRFLKISHVPLLTPFKNYQE